jgi:hypothetical protein
MPHQSLCGGHEPNISQINHLSFLTPLLLLLDLSYSAEQSVSFVTIEITARNEAGYQSNASAIHSSPFSLWRRRIAIKQSNSEYSMLGYRCDHADDSVNRFSVFYHALKD